MNLALERETSPGTQARTFPGPMTLLCLGGVPWGRSWKRNQSLTYRLSGLAPFDRLVYVNPREVWFKDERFEGREPSLSRIRRLAQARPRRPRPRVRVLHKVHFLPFKRVLGRFSGLEDLAFRALLQQCVGARPYVLWNNHPRFFDPALLEWLMAGAALRVFDLSDDFVEYHDEPEHRRLYEESLSHCCSESDLVLAVNEHVARRYGVYNPETYVVRNATNFENFDRDHFRRVAFLEELRADGSPVVGYTGIINRVRVDYELLEAVLDMRRQYHFVFVGSADPSFAELAQRHPNLHHHPQVDYDRLPDWIAGFDVCAIPFRVNDHTRGNDLLKFNDYLAMGRRIVCTDTGGARNFGTLVRIAQRAEDFAAAIDSELAATEDDREQRREVARRNSWERRSQEVHGLVVEHLDRRLAALEKA